MNTLESAEALLLAKDTTDEIDRITSGDLTLQWARDQAHEVLQAAFVCFGRKVDADYEVQNSVTPEQETVLLQKAMDVRFANRMNLSALALLPRGEQE